MSSGLLALRLLLVSGPPRPVGAVVLANTGSTDVRIWQTGNQWADTAVSFEVLCSGKIWRIVRHRQEYTRNVPSSFVLSAGSRHKWAFDLSDGEWESEIAIGQITGPPAELVAVYYVPLTPEAISHCVWSGLLRSTPVLLGASSPNPGGSI